MENTKKKRKESSDKLYLILGLISGVIGFGIFAALMIIALSLSGESTMLQMKLTIPAWMLVAVMAFTGLIVSLGLISFFEHGLKSRAHERHLRHLEKKLDLLLKDAGKTQELLQESEEEWEKSKGVLKDEPEPVPLNPCEEREVREALPYEQLDDFVDYFVGMSDSEMEDVAKQLLDERHEIREEIPYREEIPEKVREEEQKKEPPQIISFQAGKKRARRRKKTGRQKRKR